MTPIGSMFIVAQQVRDPRVRCLVPVVAALPLHCRLRNAYARFLRCSVRQRKRALRNPLAAARLVARILKARSISVVGAVPAWGIISARYDGKYSFAFRHSGKWWTVAEGVCRVDPERVVRAWEIV